jgi:hypothetical protein
VGLSKNIQENQKPRSLRLQTASKAAFRPAFGFLSGIFKNLYVFGQPPGGRLAPFTMKKLKRLILCRKVKELMA